MPFDAGGTFTRSYNWQADRDAGIKILAQRMDGEFNNYAGGLNQTFLRTGIVPMGGPLNMNSNPIVGIAGGTLISPGLRFESDTDTGIMQSGPGNLTLVTDGVAMASMSTAGGFVVTGAFTSTGELLSHSLVSAKSPTGGGASLQAGNPDNTGYLALTKTDGSRMGYVGFIPQAGGAISYMNDGGTGGHTFDGGFVTALKGLSVGSPGLNVYAGNITVTAGSISVPGGVSVDPNYYLNMNAGRPFINFDNNDYILFDRTTNSWTFVIGTGSKFGVTPTGTFIIDSLTIGDGLNVFSGGGGLPFWQWDANDYLQYDRSTNRVRFVIGNIERASIIDTRFDINTHLIVANTITANGSIQSGIGGTIGYSALNAGSTANTGYLAFHNKDSVRIGYLGFAPNATSEIQYVNDVNGGHHFAGGTVTVDGNIVSGNQIFANAGIFPKLGDNDFVIYKSGNTAIFNVASGSNFYFDRDAGLFNVVISNAGRFSVTAAGPYAFDTNRWNQLGFRDLYWRNAGDTQTLDSDRGRGIQKGGGTYINVTDLGINAIVTFINQTSSDQLLQQSGCNIYWSANNVPGNLYVRPGGIVTLLWVGGTNCYATGSGLYR